KCILGLPRIETSMLADERNIGDDRARIRSVARYSSGMIEVVEEQVLGPLCWHHNEIWSHRIAILEVDRDLHVRIALAGVQHANRFMARHERSRPVAFARDEALCDRPMLSSHSPHRMLLPFSVICTDQRSA